MIEIPITCFITFILLAISIGMVIMTILDCIYSKRKADEPVTSEYWDGYKAAYDALTKAKYENKRRMKEFVKQYIRNQDGTEVVPLYRVMDAIDNDGEPYSSI